MNHKDIISQKFTHTPYTNSTPDLCVKFLFHCELHRNFLLIPNVVYTTIKENGESKIVLTLKNSFFEINIIIYVTNLTTDLISYIYVERIKLISN